jgi:hypothetical protein
MAVFVQQNFQLFLDYQGFLDEYVLLAVLGQIHSLRVYVRCFGDGDFACRQQSVVKMLDGFLFVSVFFHKTTLLCGLD